MTSPSPSADPFGVPDSPFDEPAPPSPTSDPLPAVEPVRPPDPPPGSGDPDAVPDETTSAP